MNRRLDEHLSANELHEPMQFAYRKCHLTETVLLKLQSDIIGQLDNGHAVALAYTAGPLWTVRSIPSTIMYVLLDHLHNIRFWDPAGSA